MGLSHCRDPGLSKGPFKGLLLPGSLPPPSYRLWKEVPAPTQPRRQPPGSHVFPAEDPVTGKRKCCLHLPLQVLPPGLETHSVERSWRPPTPRDSGQMLQATDPLEPPTPGVGPPDVHPRVCPRGGGGGGPVRSQWIRKGLGEGKLRGRGNAGEVRKARSRQEEVIRPLYRVN